MPPRGKNATRVLQEMEQSVDVGFGRVIQNHAVQSTTVVNRPGWPAAPWSRPRAWKCVRGIDALQFHAGLIGRTRAVPAARVCKVESDESFDARPLRVVQKAAVPRH